MAFNSFSALFLPVFHMHPPFRIRYELKTQERTKRESDTHKKKNNADRIIVKQSQ